MNWEEALNVALDKRDQGENNAMAEVYRAFHTAATRAVSNSGNEGSHTQDVNPRLDNLMQLNVTHRTKAERLEKHNQELEKALALKTEEHKEQTKALLLLQDDMLANQIQLNVLEQRTESLQQENETLVQRLVAKAAADADKMNDANAFLER
ncbi:Autophagy protein 16 [Yarrowia sp. C11]|nr:Autophagy protein 16 [Yarrowia sp. C11]KAG5370550.1 Autophagy protein 16 [Yarrowia sp. E02]